MKKNSRIAILLDTYGPYQTLLVEGVEAVLRPLGICTIVIQSRELQMARKQYKPTNSFFNFAKLDEIDGVIAVSSILSHNSEINALHEFVQSFNIKPIVSVGLEISGVPSICVDNHSGTKSLAKHLIEVQGHKRFAFVRGFENNADSILREQTLRQTLAEYDLELDPDLIINGNFVVSDAFSKMDDLLSRRSDFDVVVAANDVMAYGIIQALNKNGHRVPYDIAVTGFDNDEESSYTAPALTTVQQPVFNLGAQAAKSLLKSIDGESVDLVQYVPTELIVRKSCGLVGDLAGSLVESSGEELDLKPDLKPDLTLNGRLEPDAQQGNIEKANYTKLFQDQLLIENGFKEILEAFMEFNENDSYLSKLWMEKLDETRLNRSSRQTFVTFLNHLDKLVLNKIQDVKLLSIASSNFLELNKVLHTVQNEILTQTYIEELSEVHSSGRQHRTMSMITSREGWQKTLSEVLPESSKRAFVVLYDTIDGVLSNTAELVVAFGQENKSIELPIKFERTKILPAELSAEFTGKYYLIPLYIGSEQFGFLFIDSNIPKMLEYDSFPHSLSVAIRNSVQIERLQQHTKKLEDANNNLATLAQYDSLTDLPNRTLLAQRLEHACLLARDNNRQVALFFLDLDRFKYVNDSLGHDSGDKLLQMVAKRLSNIVRSNDTVARLGGDEFTIVMSDITLQHEVIQMAEKILKVFDDPFNLKESTFRVSASIGIAMFPMDDEDPGALMKHADVAMYKAKSDGKNRYHFYNSSLSEEEFEQLRLAEQLRTALSENEIWVAYQPRFDINGTTIRSLEALARWTQKDGTTISPGQFIPVAEKYGLIHEVGVFILRQACFQAKAWSDQDQLSSPSISVNLSANQLHEDNIVEQVAEVLDEVGLEPSLLELEITESAAMIDVEQNIKKLHRLRDLGIKIAIDDFGTAYSSLNYLKRLPVTSLKIDQSFVRDIDDLHDVTSNTAVIRAVIALGKSMGFNLVAEGVETEVQLAFLRHHACDEIQGFLFAKPMPAAEAEPLIKQSKLDDFVTADHTKKTATFLN